MKKLVMGCAIAGMIVLSPKSEARLSASAAAPPIYFPRPDMEFGLASWYGDQFQGNLTASGESFDMTALTAAHRELPFGTKIKVTNLDNHRSAVVRVNDRGPVVAGRVLDLSAAAAHRLQFQRQGLAPVRIEVVACPRHQDCTHVGA